MQKVKLSDEKRRIAFIGKGERMIFLSQQGNVATTLLHDAEGSSKPLAARLDSASAAEERFDSLLREAARHEWKILYDGPPRRG